MKRVYKRGRGDPADVKHVMHISESLTELKVTSLSKFSFSQVDVEGMLPHEDDPMVISVQIFDKDINKVLNDLGNTYN